MGRDIHRPTGVVASQRCGMTNTLRQRIGLHS